MTAEKQEILTRLRQQISVAQGFKPSPISIGEGFGLGEIEACFSNNVFPTGTIHEFLAEHPEDAAASEGFIAGLLAKLMENGNSCLWISRNRKLFPPSLETYGVDPQQIIFLDLYYTKEILWVMEEALKCEGLACVIAEIPDIDFAQSRRLQLATEKSHVTGIILRKAPKRSLSATCCSARWQIKPQPTALNDNIPGVGNPRWEVNLLKVKNGEGGKFYIEWAEDRFAPFESQETKPQHQTITLPERGLIA
ncbi:Error-prone repair protein ImuA [Pedobacter frigidisoli]|uniref:Error-prone repair protein ImuA n=1 Tax=Pedobacter frigidisoli TaxID=2530455 RepID=A0A4R0P0I9_9SPHI|nr:Error-prone repair protein ImuA [Pedobacter frigidisoli]TCD05875.1 Error-prone repair protein ImuA [Pedobacter frigidisoli]